MWKRFLEIFANRATLVRHHEALAKRVNEQAQEIARLTDIAQRLEFELQRLNDRMDHSTQRETLEREKLLLTVENQLLKTDRQLPPLDHDQEKQ